MPNIYLDRSAGTSISTVQRVTVDEVDLTNWQGLPVKSLPRRVACASGRVLGSDQTYAHASLDGSAHHMTAAECRALAEALLVAADVLEGKREATEITLARQEREAAQNQWEAEKTERERRTAEEGVEIVCVGCGKSRRVLPEAVAGWLKSRAYCCRKRNRAYVLATVGAVG